MAVRVVGSFSPNRRYIVDPVQKSLEVYRNESGRWSLISTHSQQEEVRAEPFEAVPLELGCALGLSRGLRRHRAMSLAKIMDREREKAGAPRRRPSRCSFSRCRPGCSPEALRTPATNPSGDPRPPHPVPSVHPSRQGQYDDPRAQELPVPHPQSPGLHRRPPRVGRRVVAAFGCSLKQSPRRSLVQRMRRVTGTPGWSPRRSR